MMKWIILGLVAMTIVNIIAIYPVYQQDCRVNGTRWGNISCEEWKEHLKNEIPDVKRIR